MANEDVGAAYPMAAAITFTLAVRAQNSRYAGSPNTPPPLSFFLDSSKPNQTRVYQVTQRWHDVEAGGSVRRFQYRYRLAIFA